MRAGSIGIRLWLLNYIAKVNYETTGIYNDPINIVIPIKFKPLIESLLYYKKEKQMISGKYLVSFTDDDSNIITIDGNKLEILNFKHE